MKHEEEKDSFSSNQEYRTYNKRWFVLAVVVLLNVTGAMVWFTFTPVAYKAMQYYDTNLETINWLSIVFMVSGILVGVLATVVLEKHGLKPALILSAWFICVGSGLRIVSTIDSLSRDARLAVLFVGQCLTALGQPFSMYAPAKTGSTWFPENQRALATTFGAVGNPIGIVIAGLICPLFVVDGALSCQNLLITMFAPAAATAIFTTLVMTESEPKHPPSAGAVKKAGIFGEGLKDIVRNKTYMILLLTIGGGIGLYSTIATLLEQFLCPYGYSDQLSGICSAVWTASGVIGAAIAGAYVDVTKQFSSTAKVCYSITALGTIVFCIVYHYYMGYYILFLIVVIGFVSFGLYPLGVELGAECTYPVGVATSSGLIMICGQLQSIILVLALGAIGRPMSSAETEKYGSTCLLENTPESGTSGTTSAYNMTPGTGTPAPKSPQVYDRSVSLYICGGYVAFLALCLLLFFRPSYLRMEAEKNERNDEKKIYAIQGPGDFTLSTARNVSDLGTSL